MCRRQATVAIALLLIVGAASNAGAQDPTVQLSTAGGGALGRLQSQADLWTTPTGSLQVYVYVINPYTHQPITNLPIQMTGFAWIYGSGGHQHSGNSLTCCWPNFAPVYGNTGPSGSAFSITYTAGPAAARIFPSFDFNWNNKDYTLWPVNGIMVAEEPGDYDWIGEGPDYVLVGWTAQHPENHYAKWNMNSNCRGLAQLYHQRWNRLLAYNDSGLVWGGIFDLNLNCAPPHYEHNIGESQDVRANSLENAIPHDPVIRAWFEDQVRTLFSSFLLEDSGGANEHYHLRL